MMNGAVAWSWTVKGLDPATRLVLLSLAGRANNTTYECFPAHKTLAEDTETSVSTVKRALAKLVERGIIKVDEQRRPNEAKSSNRYRLMVDIEYRHADGKSVREGIGQNDLPQVKLNHGHSSLLDGAVNSKEGTTVSKDTLESPPQDSELDLGLPPLPPKDPTPSDLADFISEQWVARAHAKPLRGGRPSAANAEKAADLARKFAVDGQTIIDVWREIFAHVDASAFLQGQVQGKDGRSPFRLTLSFLLEKRNFDKTLEGRFDGRVGEPGRGSTSAAIARVVAGIRTGGGEGSGRGNQGGAAGRRSPEPDYSDGRPALGYGGRR